MSTLIDLLRQLEEWRHLPAYGLERRADIIIAMCLPKFMKNRFDIDVCGGGVIPEFPMRKRRICPTSSCFASLNVDFAVFGTKAGKKYVCLIELKTDIGSFKSEQLDRMKKFRNETMKCGFGTVLDDVVAIAKESREKRKYAHLIFNLIKLGCWKCDDYLNGIDLSQDGVRLQEQFLKLQRGNWNKAKMKLMTILPTETSKVDVCDNIPEAFTLISLNEFARYVARPQVGLFPNEPREAEEIARRLKNWNCVRAGREKPTNLVR